MPGFACVHHIEIGVQDGPATVDTLRRNFTFQLEATRSCPAADQWLLVKNDTRFLVTSLKNEGTTSISNDEYVINWTSPTFEAMPTAKLPNKDSVFNVAFQMKDLNASMKRLEEQFVAVTKPLRTIESPSGSIRAITVKSCVGDIHHTLLDKSNYSGYFLPGFTPLVDENIDYKNNSQEDNMSVLDSAFEMFDHVALAVKMNTSMDVIDWYERCFGMRRFFINGDEDGDQGLVLSTQNVGLRLRAMEYWKCAEVGLLAADDMEGELTARLSMVIAEGLPQYPGSTEENQIESWMRQHGGPGIQHVAITSLNIKSTVRNLRKAGAEFANPPPPAYYTEAGRLKDIIRAGEDAETLRLNGILIDTEADGIHSASRNLIKGDTVPRESYLLQVFTKPMLRSDPFFLELIQREGATGFGSGNVAALYRSVQAYIVNSGKGDDPKQRL